MRLISQPLPTAPSQLPNPALHEPIWHVPLAQVPVAFAGLHACPHAPQLRLELSCVSQPLVTLPSQFPQPGAQASTHAPAAQLGVAWFVLQTVPQLPQLFTSVLVLTSQPSFTPPLQSAKPALHEPIWHVPVPHAPVALGGLQPCPQAPQFDVVVSEVSHPSVTFALQSPHPERHASTQLPEVQLGEA